MRRMYRRQRRLYVFAGVVAAIAIVNLLFLVILYQPARSEYFELRDSIARMHAETQNRIMQISQKEKVIHQLETSNQARHALFTKHFVPMDSGFAHIYPEFDKIARETNVRWSRVESGRDVTPKFGLYAVQMKTTVEGLYPNVVSFIQKIENSDTFYIINSVDVRGGGTQPQTGTPTTGIVSLALELETYFYQ